MSRMARFRGTILGLTKLHWVAGRWMVKLHQHSLSLEIKTVAVLFHTVKASFPLILPSSKSFSELVDAMLFF